VTSGSKKLKGKLRDGEVSGIVSAEDKDMRGDIEVREGGTDGTDGTDDTDDTVGKRVGDGIVGEESVETMGSFETIVDNERSVGTKSKERDASEGNSTDWFLKESREVLRSGIADKSTKDDSEWSYLCS